MARLQRRLEDGVRQMTPDAVIVAGGSARVPGLTSLALPGAKAETLVIRLDLAGIAVSAGAACSSGKVGRSHVLSAMGLAPEIVASAIRISLGWATKEADIDRFLATWREVTAGHAAIAEVA